MSIPDFEASGNLPSGVHEATWPEVVAALGGTPERDRLLEGLRRALEALAHAGCRRAYINGSFATAKDTPVDFDACWEPAGVDRSLLDPVLLGFSNNRAGQKAKYGGELFPVFGPGGTTFLDFFQRDKATDEPKGIIAIDLGGLR